MPIGINGSGTITGISAGGLPDASITSDDIAAAAVTPAKLSQPLTLATAQNTTSGTSIDFTSIPSWVRRITVMFNGFSFNDASYGLVQIGDAGGLETTGYVSKTSFSGGSSSDNSSTSGFTFGGNSAGFALSGHMTLTQVSGNTWVASFVGSNATISCLGGGTKTLSDTLTQLRVTSTSGTSAFDAGSVNIMYEG